MTDADASPAEPRIVHLGQGIAERSDWGTIEWLANRRLTPGAELTFGHVRLEPGASNPRHLHPNCHELLYVLEGAIDHELDGVTVRLEAGDLLHIPIGAPHQAHNRDDRPCVVVVTYSTEDRQTLPA